MSNKMNTSATTDTAGNEPSPVGIRLELDLNDGFHSFYFRICPDISSAQRAEDLTYCIQSHFWTLRLVWYHSYNKHAGQLAITYGRLVQTGYNSDTPEAITDEMRGLLKEIEDLKFEMKHETKSWSGFAEEWKEKILRAIEQAEAAGSVGEPEVALINELFKGINKEWEVDV